MRDKIEITIATIMVASIITAPITVTFYFFEYIFKIINIL